MNWYKQANITQTWDKYLQQKVRTQIPNKEEQFYLNFRQGLINAEQLFTNERDANSFINTYLAKNVMSLVDVDTGHIGDRIFSDIRSSFQATLPVEQRQEIKMNEVKQILLRELPGFKEEQIDALVQDIVFNNKNTYQEIKRYQGDEETDTKKLIAQEGIYSLYQITNWGTNGKKEKHLDSPSQPDEYTETGEEEFTNRDGDIVPVYQEVHKDLESTSVCVRFKDYFEYYMEEHNGLFLIEESGKPYIMISGDDQEIKYTKNDENLLRYTDTLQERLSKDLIHILNNDNISFFNHAVQMSSEPVVNDVADLGAKPNEKTLNLAFEYRGEQDDMVETVVGHGAKYNEGDSLSIELLQHAIRRGDLYEIKSFMEAGAKNDQLAMEEVIFESIYWQKSEIIDYIMSLGFKPNPNTFDNAVQTKELDVINYMINLGAKPNRFSINRARSTRHQKIIDLVKSLPVVNASAKNWYKQAQNLYNPDYERNTEIDPDSYYSDLDVTKGDTEHLYYGRNVIWIGQKGQTVQLTADQVYPIWGNIFDNDKINAVINKIQNSEDRVHMYTPYGEMSKVSLEDVRDSIEYDDQTEHRILTTGDNELDEYLRYPDNYDDDEKVELENELQYAAETQSGDIGNMIFQLRDGNHRAFGAFGAGEPYIYATLSQSQFQRIDEPESQGYRDQLI